MKNGKVHNQTLHKCRKCLRALCLLLFFFCCCRCCCFVCNSIYLRAIAYLSRIHGSMEFRLANWKYRTVQRPRPHSFTDGVLIKRNVNKMNNINRWNVKWYGERHGNEVEHVNCKVAHRMLFVICDDCDVYGCLRGQNEYLTHTYILQLVVKYSRLRLMIYHLFICILFSFSSHSQLINCKPHADTATNRCALLSMVRLIVVRWRPINYKSHFTVI